MAEENGVPEKPVPEKTRLYLWFLAGCIPVLVVAVVFSHPLRCLLEYLISDTLLTLGIFLFAGITTALGLILSAEARKVVWSLGGGVALALLLSLLVHLLLPAIPRSECPGATPTPTPTLTPTTTPTPEPTATPVPAVWRCPDSIEGAKYVASDESDIFHCLTCEWAEKISPRNRICFASYEAAINADFRPCKVCEPP